MKTKILYSEPTSNPQHKASPQQAASGKSATPESRHIQQAGAGALDLCEIHDFLTRVVRTPAGQITPSSDLCTRVKHNRDGTTDVWMPDKLVCLRLSILIRHP